MKIGIDYSFICNGKQSVNRGVGRYTQQQIREVIHIDQNNEYIIYVPPITNHDLILAEIRTARNVQIKPYLFNQYSQDFNDDKFLIEYSSYFQDYIYSEKINLFHFTVPYFLGSLPLQFQVCPMVINYYDAIPLVFPSIYLSNNSIKNKYLHNSLLCKDANRFIAISQSAKKDAIVYLGYPADQIDIAYPIPDPNFKILPKEKLQSRLRILRKRISLPESFFLNVTGFHYTKNHSTLLRAYKNLPIAIREKIGLVFVCDLSAAQILLLQNELSELGIDQNVAFTGFVSDDDLVTLYNSAVALIHPSIYEGFGLPVIEAMCCGTPVITTTTSSLPEVGGNAAILVDPFDIAGFTDAMIKVASNNDLRNEMATKGLEHCQIFSPEQLGNSTLTCYQNAVKTKEIDEKIKIAMWTPLPPLETGIATFSTQLLDELGKKTEVELFIDGGYLPQLDLLENFSIHHSKSFHWRNEQKKFDIIIYQTGASEYHRYMFNNMTNYPGILDLHDLTFADFYMIQFMDDLEDKGLKLIAEIEGYNIFIEYEEYLRNNINGNVLLFFQNYQMIKSIVNISKAIIVHYPLAADNILENSPGAKIFTEILSVTDPWINNPPSLQKFHRVQSGFTYNDFIIGVFGIINENKRNKEIIKAFSKIVADYPCAKLLVVGRTLSPYYDGILKSLVNELGLEGDVIFTGDVSDELYHRYMSVCNLVINLRDPSRKQMSLSLIQALANGIPVIISNIPAWDFIPSNCCVRFKPDEQEIEQLCISINKFITQPDFCQEMGHQAREYYLKYCSTRKIADHYLEIVKDVIADGENK